MNKIMIIKINEILELSINESNLYIYGDYIVTFVSEPLS